MTEKRQCGIMVSEAIFTGLPFILKNAGHSFALIDTEHGGFDYSDIAPMLTSAKTIGLDIIIRLADNSRRDIIRFLDMGARGLLLPMTESAAEIEQVVRYAKYMPEGKRGISTMRAHTLYNPPDGTEYMRTANAYTQVFAQIETKKGVEAATEILSVEGVDGFLLGPNDLSADIGCLTRAVDAQIIEIIGRLGSAAKATGKSAGIITNRVNYIEAAKGEGYSRFCVGSELNIIAAGAKKIVTDIQKPMT